MDHLAIILIGLLALGAGVAGYIRQQRLIRQLTQRFERGEKRVREQVVRDVETTLTKSPADGLVEILLKALRDQESSVRILAASTLQKNIDIYVRSGKNKRPVISSLMQPRVVSAMLSALKDEVAEVRRYAAGTLGKTDVAEVLEALLNALDDEDQNVRVSVMEALRRCPTTRPIPYLLKALTGEDRRYALRVLEELCLQVHALVYGKRSADHVVSRQHSLQDPDLSHLNIPMSKLKDIIIDAATCDREMIKALGQYAGQHLDQDRIRKRIRLLVYGAMGDFPPTFSQAFNQCQHVEIDTETIVFGAGTRHEYEHAAQTCWRDPDTTHLMLPLNNLKQVVVYIDSYDFRLLERFFTYTVNYIGQKDLKKEVEVHIYGDPEQLPDNIRNNFTNLCKDVTYHT